MMRDFLRFVLRGTWAGTAFVLAIWILLFGSMGALLLLNPVFLLYSASPGAVVGLVLWLIAGKTTEPLSQGARFGIGTGIAAAILLLMSFYQTWISIGFRPVYGFDMPSMLMRIAVYSAGVGGLAGLACPASREQVSQESKLTYRERLQLYEAAEREARKLARGLHQRAA
jgi:hypothetical protein